MTARYTALPESAQPASPSSLTTVVSVPPSGASIVAAARTSPRVSPWFTITTGMPREAARRTDRNPDMTVSDDPRTPPAAPPAPPGPPAPARVPGCARRQARPRRVRAPQPLVKRRSRGAPPARQAHHPVQAAVQLGHGTAAGRLVQPVHVLGDDPAQQPVPLELGHRQVPGVRRRPGDVPPAQMAARPVPLPRRRAPGERLVGHRLPAPRQPAGPPVVRNAGLRRQPRAAQDNHVAAAEKLNHHPERPRLAPRLSRLRFRAHHSSMLPHIPLRVGNSHDGWVCTVVLSFAPGERVPLLLLGVRDELKDRPWLPPARHWPGSA